MMWPLIWVALGGAAGSMARYSCQKLFNTAGYPAGTLAVNIGGCFVIGVLMALALKQADEQRWLLLATGFCGGFTTFSAFSLEALQMLQQSRLAAFSVYVLASVGGGIIATFAGYKIMNA